MHLLYKGKITKGEYHDENEKNKDDGVGKLEFAFREEEVVVCAVAEKNSSKQDA